MTKEQAIHEIHKFNQIHSEFPTIDWKYLMDTYFHLTELEFYRFAFHGGYLVGGLNGVFSNEFDAFLHLIGAWCQEQNYYNENNLGTK